MRPCESQVAAAGEHLPCVVAAIGLFQRDVRIIPAHSALQICEMKRLYVRPEFRGKGLGRSLVNSILVESRSIGYQRMRLDTLPQMKEAMAMYRSIGFRAIPAYCHNRVPGATFLELDLRNPGQP